MTPNIFIPWIGFAASLVTGSLGLVTLAHQPKSVARVSFAVGMLLLAIESALGLLGNQTQQLSSALVYHEGRLIIMAVMAPVWLVFSLHYARGGDARASKGWKGIALLSWLLPLGAILVPGAMVSAAGAGAHGSAITVGFGGKAMYLHAVVILTTIVTLGNLEQTFRAVTGTMRWRIKFLLFGLGVIFLVRLYSSGWALVQQECVHSDDLVRSVGLVVAGVLIIWSLARMGLTEAEVYPSQKVIVTAATTSLVTVYLCSVAILAKVVSRPVGEREIPLPALVVLVGLLLMGLLLLSDRIRQRAILFFSRHFNRPLYDYRGIWQTYAERVVRTKDEPEFCRVSAAFVSELFQALSVTIWQVDVTQRRLAFGGSTLLTVDSANDLLCSNPLPFELIETLLKQHGVMDLDDPRASWTDARSQLFAGQFQEAGGHRLCVPLRVAENTLGLLLVGDRVGARAYSAEELDLLHTIAGEIGRGLLSLKSARHLLNDKEIQAFQNMSAFFVHDLKNTASTLSLTLQNLGRHSDKPAFREEAVRSVSLCVSHINELIGGLSVLRQDLKVSLQDSDLNTLIQETLEEMKGALACPVECRLGSIPRVALDPIQMKKVLANLLLNACDASSQGGSVQVATGLREPYGVVLSVQDTGCGMDEDYVRDKLFRPFHSTKNGGLGIGLYHAKTIVDAHHGEIEVDSAVQIGTTFRVCLPMKGGEQ